MVSQDGSVSVCRLWCPMAKRDIIGWELGFVSHYQSAYHNIILGLIRPHSPFAIHSCPHSLPVHMPSRRDKLHIAQEEEEGHQPLAAVKQLFTTTVQGQVAISDFGMISRSRRVPRIPRTHKRTTSKFKTFASQGPESHVGVLVPLRIERR